MREATTVLDVLRERGRRGLPLERLYRQLFNPQLYLLAYGRLYSNKGAMTPGPDGETVDGMSLAKIGRIIDALRHERFRFKPVRRTYIPKKNGKERPLGLPSWSDKLVGEVIRLLLEAYYEPQFSDRSHGFRPERGCHTALSEVVNRWPGTTWFIEGDIADCFGSLDHKIMLSMLAGDIHDGRFLRLLQNMLQAGYLEDWVWHETLSGAPQGGVASPILSNIYLHRLDRYVEDVLIPEYTRGADRVANPDYQEMDKLIMRARRRGDRPTVRALRKQRRSMPSKDPVDPGFRRLRYVRYCDDHLLGFTGPKSEAEDIKIRLATFLREELNLELSREKTLITHARTGAARFLGYEIVVQHADHKVTGKGRSINGTVGLRVPHDVIKKKSGPYLKLGKPERLNHMVNEDDHTIVRTYGAQYRGLVEYYLLAGDVYRLNRLEWVMKTSMLKTLACKHDSTVTTMADRYKTTIATPHGPRRCFEVSVEREGRKPLVARFGGIPLRRKRNAVLIDRVPAPVTVRRKELITRLQAGRCELCKQADPVVDVHHVRKLADLDRPGRPQPVWDQLMAKKRRKSLIVCADCHGSHPRRATNHDNHAVVTGELDARKRAGPVREGVVGSGPSDPTRRPTSLIGPYKNNGREWMPKGQPEPVNVYDFIDPEQGKVTPYGVYDVTTNTGWVGVGTDHDTAAFAVATIGHWWDQIGRAAYPDATRLLITADGGGSNGSRTRQWKTALAALATRTGLTITVTHLPPGTSKWNRVEHRLFSFISINWRGRPLTSHEVVIETIGATKTATGLTVQADLDTTPYPTGVKISDREMKALTDTGILTRHDYHGEWNYSLNPLRSDTPDMH